MSRWWRRVAVLVLVAVGGQVALTLLDFDPDPLRWALMATTGVTLLWLVLDVLGIGTAPWDEPLSPYARPDAADDSVQHRVVANHLAARDPGPALHRLLVGLARARDPALSDPELRALAEEAPRRLKATDIDRYLTRIEQPHDDD